MVVQAATATGWSVARASRGRFAASVSKCPDQPAAIPLSPPATLRVMLAPLVVALALTAEPAAPAFQQAFEAVRRACRTERPFRLQGLLGVRSACEAVLDGEGEHHGVCAVPEVES